MVDLQSSLSEAFYNYYKSNLRNGYINDESELDKLLVAAFLVDLINSEAIIPTEEEFTKVVKLYNKLSTCSCLIPKASTKCKRPNVNTHSLFTNFRRYENNILQFRLNDVPKATN